MCVDNIFFILPSLDDSFTTALEHLKPFTFPLSYPSAIVRSLFINKTSNFIFQNGCHLIMTDLNYYVFFNHRREFHFMMASEKKSSASTLIEWERKTNHV